ncbi:MAG TPA: PP2C family protein-serine/threonine phosphatase, partial [Anaerolineae bacterium]
DLFVTVFYAVLDPETGVLAYCNAGHNPPLLLPANGDPMQKLPLTALPLGLLEDEAWEQETMQIRPGDVLILYTDGLTEAEDELEDYFGESRLATVAQANLDRPVEVIENKIITAVYDFMDEAAQRDDITLMVVVRNAG